MAAGARLELSNAIRINNAIDATGQIGFVSSGNVLADVITNNNTVYNVNAGTTNEVSAYITGKGGLELVVGGVLKVTGTTNDYQGATTISNGTLRVDTLANGGTTNTFVKAGAGEIVLSNGSFSDNFAAAAIQVNAGSLTLGAANQIADGTDLILNGGTFRAGNGSAGYAESFGDLTLNASSTIDLGAAAGLRDLVFIDSSGVAWSGSDAHGGQLGRKCVRRHGWSSFLRQQCLGSRRGPTQPDHFQRLDFDQNRCRRFASKPGAPPPQLQGSSGSAALLPELRP